MDIALRNAAQDYELAEDAVGQITLDLDRLAQLGLLVRVEVTGIHQFRRRATWELFGVAAKDVRRQNITQGMIACWTVKQVQQLESIEEQIRAHLVKYSHGIDWFAPWRYVRRGTGDRGHPQESPYWTWRLDFEQLQATLAALVEEMTTPAAYAAARAEYTAQLQVMAEEAWPAMERRLQILASYLADGAAVEIPDKDVWMQGQVDKALERFPSVATIRSTVRARAYYQQIANPLAVIEYQRQVAEARQAAAVDAIRADVQREAIEQEILNSTVIQLLQLQEPVAQMLNETPADIGRMVVETLELLFEGGRFQHTSKEKVRGWLPLYRLMSGSREPAVEAALAAAAAALPVAGDKNTGPLTWALQDLLQTLRPAVEAMARIRPEVWLSLLDRADAVAAPTMEIV